MNLNKNGIFASFLLLGLTLSFPLNEHAQGTAFTYQGRLSNGASAVTGLYDFRFMAFDAEAGGQQIGPTENLVAVGVTNGLFTVTLDFGANVFTGPARYLDLAATPSGGVSAFVSMTPRQPLTPAPYAMTAANLSGPLAAGNLSGSYSNAVGFGNPGNTFTGAFSGDGSNLSNIPFSAFGGASLFSQSPLAFNAANNRYGVGGGLEFGLALADFNGNGQVDIAYSFVGADKSGINLLQNNFDGTFTQIDGGSSGPFSGRNPLINLPSAGTLVAADLNGDGKPDLICPAAANVSVFTNSGSGFAASASLHFTHPGSPISYLQAIVADFDGDGSPDIAAYGFNGSLAVIDIFTNNGGGNFIYATTAFSNANDGSTTLQSIAAIDVGGDGIPEIAGVDGNHSLVRVYHPNFGSGLQRLPQPFPVGDGPVGLVLLDVNGDGAADIITANNAGRSLTILTNDQAAGFAVHSTIALGTLSPQAIKIADMNQDHFPDLVVSVIGDAGDSLLVLTNDMHGSFARINALSVPTRIDAFSVGNGFAVADLNHDGTPDFVAVNGVNENGFDESYVYTYISQPPALAILPAAILTNSANRFSGSFSGSVSVGPEDLVRLDDRPLYLRGPGDNSSGLVYGRTGFFDPSIAPDGPVLWGGESGALATSIGTDGVQPVPRRAGILYWTKNGVGIFTNNPHAALAAC